MSIVRRIGAIALVVAVCGVLAGSQAGAGAVSGTSTVGTSGTVLATGRPGHPISATVDLGAVPEGPTSHELVVGRPGSTDEIDDTAYLPATAVLRETNQLDAAQSAGPTSLTVRFTPDRPGRFPLFLFASAEMGCASGNMADETVGFTITPVGSVDVR